MICGTVEIPHHEHKLSVKVPSLAQLVCHYSLFQCELLDARDLDRTCADELGNALEVSPLSSDIWTQRSDISPLRGGSGLA